MGNENKKSRSKHSDKNLSEKEIQFLESNTRLNRKEIEDWHAQFLV